MLCIETLNGLDSPEAQHFILNSYAERYPAGRARAKQLVFLARKLVASNKNAPMLDLLCRKINSEICPTHDAETYRALQRILQEGNFPAFNDSESKIWLERVERENRVLRAQLENNLLKAKSEGGKEGPRLALKDLGSFFAETGDGQNATRVLFQAQEYCTTNSHHLEVYLMIAEVSWNFHNSTYASTFATKAEPLSAPKDLPRIKILLALCELEAKRYKQCAKSILLIADTAVFPTVASSEDLATVCVLCALATFTRRELQVLLLQGQVFKPALETVPVMKELVTDFCSSQYHKVMQVMQAGKLVLPCDPLLAAHVDYLMEELFVKCVMQFSSPYSVVRLDRMSLAFQLPALEEKVIGLITKDSISDFRVDAQNKVLVRRLEDSNAKSLREALQTGREYVRETKSLLLRESLLESNIIYISPSSSKRLAKAKVPSSLMFGLDSADQIMAGSSGEDE